MQSFETCLIVSSNLYVKLVSSVVLSVIFDDNLKAYSVEFLQPILTDQDASLLT